MNSWTCAEAGPVATIPTPMDDARGRKPRRQRGERQAPMCPCPPKRSRAQSGPTHANGMRGRVSSMPRTKVDDSKGHGWSGGGA